MTPKPKPKPKPFLCVVAGQRSGSTALRSALVSTRLFRNFHEVFQEGRDAKPGTFRQFAESRSLQLADMTSWTKVDAIIADFLDDLEVQAAGKIPIIDIKHNSWNALRPFWGHATDEPLLMRRLRQRGACFLFLARRDLTAQIVSERIAETANRWHDLTPEDVTGPVRVDPAEALRKARLILETEKLLLGHLADSPRVLPVWYEDLYKDGFVNPAVVNWLNGKLGTKIADPLQPLNSQNRLEKASVVAGYDALGRAIDAMIAEQGRVSFPDLPGDRTGPAGATMLPAT